MNHTEETFAPLDAAAAQDDFAQLARRSAPAPAAQPALPAPVLARLHGFDLLERPEVTGLPGLPGQRRVARTTVALRHAQIGSDVLLVFEDGDVHRPIIVGVLAAQAAPATAVVEVDDERQVIVAEREIVLRCGDASITLTRAGKVIIQGRYILSRSSGYNKIKGAAVDIN